VGFVEAVDIHVGPHVFAEADFSCPPRLIAFADAARIPDFVRGVAAFDGLSEEVS